MMTETAQQVNDIKAQAKKIYNAKHTKLKIYNEGDLVLTTNQPIGTGTLRKLEPFIISKVDVVYARRTQRHYTAAFASDQLRPGARLSRRRGR